jgi:hypothetical protein
VVLAISKVTKIKLKGHLKDSQQFGEFKRRKNGQCEILMLAILERLRIRNPASSLVCDLLVIEGKKDFKNELLGLLEFVQRTNFLFFFLY